MRKATLCLYNAGSLNGIIDAIKLIDNSIACGIMMNTDSTFLAVM